MSLSIIHSRGRVGLHAPAVTVETHLSNGLPNFSIVGLPEKVVKESRDRVRSALMNAHLEFPTRRITVNLAPADLPKEGCRFDLPIALGILAASGQIPTEYLNEYEFAGELALTGELRPVQALLPLALATRNADRKLIFPADNVREAVLAQPMALYPARHLLEVCAHFTGQTPLACYTEPAPLPPSPSYADLSDIQGQHHAKRALEIAAAGEHSMLMVGPPGTGKTMLASRLPGLLPNMTDSEALEIATLASISTQRSSLEPWGKRPFRAPHHSASSVALVGGGNPPRPGEVSLAHQGILFLDELPEFGRSVLEALREPLESGVIVISRAARQAEFPAKFQLIAAMNPCPCGHLGNPHHECRCTPAQIQRYRHKISGPLLDRIDLQIEMAPLPPSALVRATQTPESSTIVRSRITRARQIQQDRAGKTNAALNQKEIKTFCSLSPALADLLDARMQTLKLSARSYHRVLKLTRTIADLEESIELEEKHLLEALSYRKFERISSS